jgi:hypothetical protein
MVAAGINNSPSSSKHRLNKIELIMGYWQTTSMTPKERPEYQKMLA